MPRIKYLPCTKYIFIFLLLITVTTCPVFAYVMKSSNYHMQSDSLNIGGGRGTSTNYIWEDTIGEVASGISASGSYKLKAGYQQMQEVYISISSPSDITLTPSIPGMTGSATPASGSATWTVTTDSPSGFNMKIKASDDPSMQLSAGDHFFDYTPAQAGTPDYNWTTPAAGSAEFGFSVEPETAADTIQLFKNNGSACDAGDNNTADKCWFDFNGQTDITVINKTSRTDTDGENEVIKFRAELNGDAAVRIYEEGNYSAYITVTAATN